MAVGALKFLQVICGLVTVLDPATAALELSVTYPLPSNRSVVELSCRQSGNLFNVDGAKFLRNKAVITTNSGFVSVESEGMGTIRFSFTQQQECTDQTWTSDSNAIGLAGKYVLHVVLMLLSYIQYSHQLFFYSSCTQCGLQKYTKRSLHHFSKS